MNFEGYQRLHDCTPLEKTEQSWTFTVFINGGKRVVKRYPTAFDRCREELAYCYIRSKDLLRIPKLTGVGDDFVEMQFIDKSEDPKKEEAIAGVAKMYAETNGISHPKGYFPKLDLSKDKLFHRLDYLPAELDKRGAFNHELISASRKFIETDYRPSPNQCLVHGDLKSLHVIKSKEGVFFIDLALVSVASPWYDLAFLFMEHRDRKGVLEKLSSLAFEIIGPDFRVTREEVTNYLKSAIFYRSLYDVVFAARHRSDKTLARTIKDLKEILEGNV